MTKTTDDSSIWVRSGLNLLARKAVGGTIVNRAPNGVAGRSLYGKYQFLSVELHAARRKSESHSEQETGQ